MRTGRPRDCEKHFRSNSEIQHGGCGQMGIFKSQ